MNVCIHVEDWEGREVSKSRQNTFCSKHHLHVTGATIRLLCVRDEKHSWTLLSCQANKCISHNLNKCFTAMKATTGFFCIPNSTRFPTYALLRLEPCRPWSQVVHYIGSRVPFLSNTLLSRPYRFPVILLLIFHQHLGSHSQAWKYNTLLHAITALISQS